MRLTIETPAGYLEDVGLGDSIALNGACMTATALDSANNRFSIDISAESLAKTTGLAETGVINLEKALRAQDRLGGTSLQAMWMALAASRISPKWAKAGSCASAPRVN